MTASDLIMTPIAYTSSQNLENVLFGEHANSNGGGARVQWAKVITSATDISTILPNYKDWVDSTFIGVSAR
jgi:hypothetical protein